MTNDKDDIKNKFMYCVTDPEKEWERSLQKILDSEKQFSKTLKEMKDSGDLELLMQKGERTPPWDESVHEIREDLIKLRDEDIEDNKGKDPYIERMIEIFDPMLQDIFSILLALIKDNDSVGVLFKVRKDGKETIHEGDEVWMYSSEEEMIKFTKEKQEQIRENNDRSKNFT